MKRISTLFHAFIQWLLVDNFTKQHSILRSKAFSYIHYHVQTGFSLIKKDELSKYATTDAFFELPTVEFTTSPEGRELCAITDIVVDSFGGVSYTAEGWETGIPVTGGYLNALDTGTLCIIADRIRKGKIFRN